jgi:hypothetical protein
MLHKEVSKNKKKLALKKACIQNIKRRKEYEKNIKKELIKYNDKDS